VTVNQTEPRDDEDLSVARWRRENWMRNLVSRRMLAVLLISMVLSTGTLFGVWSYHAERLHQAGVRSHAAKVEASRQR
jgi:hypothetical protein